MQVVSMVCSSEIPFGICVTGFTSVVMPQCEGNLDAPGWIPAGGCYESEMRHAYCGELRMTRSAAQCVVVRGEQ